MKAGNKFEWAGNPDGGNCWLKIGLTRSELALVTRLSKDFDFERSPNANTARLLVMMALANLRFIMRPWQTMMDYCRAEGLSPEDFLSARARQGLDSFDEDEGEAWKNG